MLPCPNLRTWVVLRDKENLEKNPYSKSEERGFKWKDMDNEEEDSEDFDDTNNSAEPKPLPKISYTDKMLVSVMGAVFNMLLAFAYPAFCISSGMQRCFRFTADKKSWIYCRYCG